MKKPNQFHPLVYGLCVMTSSVAFAAHPIVFPEDSGVVDVTKAPYNAIPNDGKDDTVAIQKALDAHANKNAIIYLPAGEYTISNTLNWSKGWRGGLEYKRTILQGAGPRYTTIRLQDSCPGFNEAGKKTKSGYPIGKPMVWTGKAPAQRFRNSIRELTLDTGNGNLGACGAQYIANNQGTVKNVLIRSGDGKGQIGLDLGFSNEQGPCLIKNVIVEGFDYGIAMASAVDSITMSNVKVQNQNVTGIYNNGQVVSIENLISRQSQKVPALNNQGGDGVVTIIGYDADTEILNKGVLYARTKNGEDRIEGGHLLAPAQVGKTAVSLKLPVKPTPEVAEDPLSQWVSPLAFGGKPNDKHCDADALQKAIDSGKTTVYLPNGEWRLDKDVYVRGNVRRVVGCESRFQGGGAIRVVDGTSPVVVIERFDLIYSGVAFLQESSRTVVFSSITGNFHREGFVPGTGDVFFEDVCGAPFFFKNQNVWARQLNPESKTTMITCENSNFWVLGLKTEREGTVIDLHGGQAEVAGAFIYANTKAEKNPIFVLRDGAKVSATMGEACYNWKPFVNHVVRRTAEGDTVLLKNTEAPGRWQFGRKYALMSTESE